MEARSQLRHRPTRRAAHTISHGLFSGGNLPDNAMTYSHPYTNYEHGWQCLEPVRWRTPMPSTEPLATVAVSPDELRKIHVAAVLLE
jgi:hypothetical protein